MKAGLLPILAILAAAALGATSGLYIKGLAFSGLAFGGVVVLNFNRNFSLAGPDLFGSGCMILSALLFSGTAIMFKDALMEVKETDTLYFQAIGVVMIVAGSFAAQRLRNP